MVDPLQHADDRNWFESILRMIPGFHGYLEREYRRESDLLTRRWMAERLEKAKPSLDETIRKLMEQARLADLPKVERLRAQVDKLIGRFRAAPVGYSGLFDYVRVKEELLDRIYAHDMSLLKDVTAVAERMEALPAALESLDESTATISSQLDELGRLFDHRGELLAGLASADESAS